MLPGQMIVRRSLSAAVSGPTRIKPLGSSKPFVPVPHPGFKEKLHATEASCKMWRNLTYFLAIPACIVMGISVYIHETSHPPERPEFIPYEHLRIRNKRFPWGDGNHSLFHNPHMNALPDGYEDEDH